MKKKWLFRTMLTFFLVGALALQPAPLSMMQLASVVSSANEVEEDSMEAVEKKSQEEEGLRGTQE